MLKVTTVLAALLVAAPSHAQLPASGPLPEVGTSTIGYPTVQAALDALKSKPGVTIGSHDGWTIISDKEPGTDPALWSFAPEGHPAYPSAVKRTVIERDGQVLIEMSVLCSASKAACDALVRDFQALNDSIREDMQGRGK